MTDPTDLPEPAQGRLRHGEEQVQKLVTGVREYAIFLLDRSGRRSEEAGFNSHLVNSVEHAALERLLGELKTESALPGTMSRKT